MPLQRSFLVLQLAAIATCQPAAYISLSILRLRTGIDLGRMPTSHDVAYLSDGASQLPDASEPPSRDEIHGPNSCTSMCAYPGVACIASRIGASNHTTCATLFMSTISRKLKLPKRLG